MSLLERRSFACLHHQGLSLARRCELTGVQRSGIYFKPKQVSLLNLQLMKLIDRKFTECPFYGVPRMTTYLNKDMGYHVNDKRIARLYKVMGLQAIYPKKQLSKPNQAHPVYPYLLKGI